MPFDRVADDVFVWADTCNVYVLRDGDAGLLIDFGDGSVVDHLGEIGVRSVEWVLFTHHHREQCQGAHRLAGLKAKVAGPEAERAMFERPGSFRKMKPALGDAHSVYGASYVRPPAQAVRLDQGFRRMDEFAWRGREFWCLDTAGNSPGHMSYLLRRGDGRSDGRWVAFSGDVMLDGARMHTWFDTEWDYGYGKGIYALHNAAALLERFEPAVLLPAHGPAIREPQRQLREYQGKLRELAKHYLRGYELGTFAGADQDRVSKPTVVPHVWQVSPHLFKFKGPDYWPNFTLILAESGRGLVVDCGLFEVAFLDKAIAGMKDRLGLKQIDAVIVTHMHGDHCLEAPHLRERWGAKIWTLDRVVDKVRRPERYDYGAPLNAYGTKNASIAFDRTLRDGETFFWEGFELTADWMPGQTEFALCLHGTIDGRKVAFTGDNLFASPTDPAQSGHEAVVAHNSGILEEGYLYAASYLHGLQPDLILGGHSWVMDKPAALIERYRAGAEALRAAFRALSSDEDYRYWFDPYWVRVEPYRTTLRRGESAEVSLHVRNFRERAQAHRIEPRAGAGVVVEPAVVEGKVGAGGRGAYPLRLTAAADAPLGVRLVPMEMTVDGRRYGQLFDFVVDVVAR